MTLVPFKQKENWWDPFRELEKIQTEMNSLFDFSLARRGGRTMGLLDREWSPAVDVYESKDQILVKADIPGMSKNDIEVTVEGDTLIIKGEKKEEKNVKEENFIRTERAYGSFYRALTLPKTVDAAGVKASYKDGVLELALPKKEEAKPKQISIDVK